MNSISKLKNIWLDSLSVKYGYTDPKSKGLVDEAVGALSSIFLKFSSSAYADKKFSKQIINGTRKQYDQALAEMLFFDILERDGGFEYLPTSGQGADFNVVRSGLQIMCEVITPESDTAGIIEMHNNDIDTRVFAGARRGWSQDLEIFLKVTAALKSKQEKYIQDKQKGLIPEDAACIVVVNDALFCPVDIPMFGVSHSANWGEPPFVVRATLNNFTLLTESLKPIFLNGFTNETLSHISAVIQVTLRDDYGYRVGMANKVGEEFCKLSGLFNNYDIVLNPNARIKLPENIFKMDHWYVGDSGGFYAKRSIINPTLADFFKYESLLKRFCDPQG